MRFYDSTTQIEFDSTIPLNRILDFTILNVKSLRFAILQYKFWSD
jgi:hypothetical protein